MYVTIPLTDPPTFPIFLILIIFSRLWQSFPSFVINCRCLDWCLNYLNMYCNTLSRSKVYEILGIIIFYLVSGCTVLRANIMKNFFLQTLIHLNFKVIFLAIQPFLRFSLLESFWFEEVVSLSERFIDIP